jgi:pimeloyl-ACP methyl ester carboxylesterase
MVCLRESSVALSDGRRLGFAEYGVRGGKPILYFHGLPGGRFYSLGARALIEHGAWSFTLERPGIGLSDAQPGRTLLDWPRDVEAFTDAMDLDRFAVLGTSGGAPYALACGYALPDRVTAVALQCGYCPYVDDPSFDDAIDADWRDAVRRYRDDPASVLEEDRVRVEQRVAKWGTDPKGLFAELFGGTDQDSALYGQFRDHWMRILAATYGQNPGTDEYRILYEPWGFQVEDVHVPIHAWHGDADTAAPIGLVERVVAAAPHAELTVCPGEGHYLDGSHHAAIVAFLTASP